MRRCASRGRHLGRFFVALAAVLGATVIVPLGTAGPAAAADSVAYREARDRFFDGPVEPGAQRVVLDVDVDVPDVGIVVARSFIDGNSATNELIGDDRSWSFAPLASARTHLAWDTGRDQVSLLVQESCTAIAGVTACVPALPIQLVADAGGIGDGDGEAINYATVVAGPEPGQLSFDLAVMTSAAASLPPPRVNAEGVLAPAEVFPDPDGSTIHGPGVVTLTADRYPSWEFRKYPRLVEEGDPDRLTLGDRAAGRLLDLIGTPQVQCASRGTLAPPYLNLMGCNTEPPSTGLPAPTDLRDAYADAVRTDWSEGFKSTPDPFEQRADILEVTVSYLADVTLGLRTRRPIEPSEWDYAHPPGGFARGGVAWWLETDSDPHIDYTVSSRYLDGEVVTTVTGEDGAPVCQASDRFDGDFYEARVQTWCLAEPTAIRVIGQMRVTEDEYRSVSDSTDWSLPVSRPRIE